LSEIFQEPRGKKHCDVLNFESLKISKILFLFTSIIQFFFEAGDTFDLIE
jgi:hypothetical protein